jgi:hypothetical protein
MAQFIPTVPGIGAALGSGFSSGIDKIASLKIDQMLKQQQSKEFTDALNALAQQNQPQQQEQQVTPEGQLQAGQVPTQAAAGTTAQAPAQQKQDFNPLLKAIASGKNLTPQQIQTLLGIQQAQQQQQEKRGIQERKEAHQTQKEIDQRTQPFYDKIIEGGKSAKQIKHRLTKLKELDAKGKLPPAALYNILTSLESIGTKEGAAIGGAIGGALGTGTGALLGGPLGATFGLTEGSAQGAALGAGLGAAIKPVTSILRSALIGAYPDTEEYEKTSLEFIKDVRPLIGGHVTENQLDLFLRSIPTLATTAEGRKTIINNIGILAEAATAEYDALEEIIEKNGGKRPDGVEFKVSKIADEKRKEYAKRWQD